MTRIATIEWSIMVSDCITCMRELQFKSTETKLQTVATTQITVLPWHQFRGVGPLTLNDLANEMVLFIYFFFNITTRRTKTSAMEKMLWCG